MPRGPVRKAARQRDQFVRFLSRFLGKYVLMFFDRSYYIGQVAACCFQGELYVDLASQPFLSTESIKSVDDAKDSDFLQYPGLIHLMFRVSFHDNDAMDVTLSELFSGLRAFEEQKLLRQEPNSSRVTNVPRLDVKGTGPDEIKKRMRRYVDGRAGANWPAGARVVFTDDVTSRSGDSELERVDSYQLTRRNVDHALDLLECDNDGNVVGSDVLHNQLRMIRKKLPPLSNVRSRRGTQGSVQSPSCTSKGRNLSVTGGSILLLGISQPSVDALRADHPTASAKELIQITADLVESGEMTQIDGRDQARCLALEADGKTEAYSVSMESASEYGSRHLYANFNRTTFVKLLKRTWGDVTFRQIALDYYWCPPFWTSERWGSGLFEVNLPKFVTEGLLDEGGVVFLPFCLHCFTKVVALKDKLSSLYSISFIYKSEMTEHALWRATNSIERKVMSRLGKSIDQENIYCSPSEHEFRASGEDEKVTKETLLHILNQIENVDDVRMIKLQALSGDAKGGFVGLNVDRVRSKKRKRS